MLHILRVLSENSVPIAFVWLGPLFETVSKEAISSMLQILRLQEGLEDCSFYMGISCARKSAFVSDEADGDKVSEDRHFRLDFVEVRFMNDQVKLPRLEKTESVKSNTPDFVHIIYELGKECEPFRCWRVHEDKSLRDEHAYNIWTCRLFARQARLYK
jgi:hypothetical protein